MIISATGHRPDKLGGYNIDAFFSLVDVASEWLTQEKPEKVVVGMALGWDQAVMQAALDCKVPQTTCCIPFRGYEMMWPKQSQDYYWSLIRQATSSVVICSGGYEAWKMQERNKAMVDMCDIILAMFDGSSGGTANCLKYAQKQGKTVINLYENWKKI